MNFGAAWGSGALWIFIFFVIRKKCHSRQPPGALEKQDVEIMMVMLINGDIIIIIIIMLKQMMSLTDTVGS